MPPSSFYPNRTRTFPTPTLPRYNVAGRKRNALRQQKKKTDRSRLQLFILTVFIIAVVAFSILERRTIIASQNVLLSNSRDRSQTDNQNSRKQHSYSQLSVLRSGSEKTIKGFNVQPFPKQKPTQSQHISKQQTSHTTHSIDLTKNINSQSIHSRLEPVGRNHQIADPAVKVSSSGSLFKVSLDGSFNIQDLDEKRPLPITDMHHTMGNRDAKLAFFMQISEVSLPLLPRLLVVMWHPNNIYVLHFDAKIPNENYEQIRSSLKSIHKFSNIHLLPREPITYKGVSMLLNTLSAIEFLLQKSDDWDYFLNLSGSDYPSINIATMMRMLGQNDILQRKVSFLQVAPRKALWSELKQSRFDFFYLDTSLGMMDKKHELLHTWLENPLGKHMGIKFIQSEAWIIAHRSFAHFSVRSSYARKLLLLLSNMQDPEEHFFAMLAWNNPQFNNTLSHHAFRGIFWKIKGVKAGQHPYYADMRRPDGQYQFGESIMGVPYFFIRKFRTPTEEVLDTIDSKLSGTHKFPDMKSVSEAFFRIRSLVACVTDFNFRDNHTEVHGANVCKGPVITTYNETRRPSLPR